MLSEAYHSVRKVYCAVGYTDLRKGIDGLAQIVGTKYDLNPYEKDILFLFCGKRCDRIKGLLWEGTGIYLLKVTGHCEGLARKACLITLLCPRPPCSGSWPPTGT